MDPKQIEKIRVIYEHTYSKTTIRLGKYTYAPMDGFFISSYNDLSDRRQAII